MTKRGGELRVVISEDGILLCFIASNGGEIGLNVLTVAGELDDAEARILVQWCWDRLGNAAAHNLPADVREGIEDRIAELSALLDAKAAKPS
jgi:hypothetical protein